MRRIAWRSAVPVALLSTIALAGGSAGLSPASAEPDRGPAQISPARAEAVGGQDAARGRWRVRPGEDGRYVVSWTSPRPLPVAGDRPRILDAGDDLGPTRTVGRTVSVLVDGSAPDPASLDVVLSGEVLDAPARSSRPSAPRRSRTSTPPITTLLTADPGRRGSFTTTSSDYALPSVRLAGMSHVEMVGHVVRPADGQLTAAAPLVLFLHGRHSYCYDPTDPDRDGGEWPCRKGLAPIPSHLGYDYLQRLLASQGYLTVSISADAINAQDGSVLDGGAAARAELIRRHLDQWVRWAADGTYPVDLDDVVLVGHSRGGEGVNRASEQIPRTAPYRIAGQVLIAPTNFGRQTAAYVPTVTVLPYCDGDVSDLQGQTYTDVARGLAGDDTSLHSTVLVMGADHNFFNTEWTPGLAKASAWDDWGGRGGLCGRKAPTRLTAAGQRQVAKAYVAGAVALMTRHDPTVVPLFDGSAVRVRSAAGADVRSEAVNGGRQMIPAAETTLTSGTAETQLCLGYSDAHRPRFCGRSAKSMSAPHWPGRFPNGIPAHRAFEMTWSHAGATGGMALAAPVDLTASSSLDLRTVVDPEAGDARVRIRIVDADGRTATYAPPQSGLVPSLPRDADDPLLAKYLAQDLRIPTSALTGVDLRRITEVGLTSLSRKGRLWVLDLAVVPASITTAGLPSVPDLRLPLIDLGTVRQSEGDSRVSRTIDVPFTVVGALTRPARFVVTVSDRSVDAVRAPVTVDLAPGTTSGTVTVPYRADDLDDPAVRGFDLAAYAVRGVMPRRGFGEALILDDDPTPKMTVRAVHPRVREGNPVRWEVRLAEPVAYDVYLNARFVTGPEPLLSIGDLPRRWAATQLGYPGVTPATPLTGKSFWLFRDIRAGDTSAVFTVPTVTDGVKEPAESVTLRVISHEPRLRIQRTVRVTDR